MVCNTGVGLTPLVDGQVHHFQARGLYDGLFLMWDEESGTYWNHISGEALYGPLVGTKLQLENVLHTTPKLALAEDDLTRIAVSNQSPRRRRGGRSWVDRVPVLRGMFRSTIDEEDTRRPTMDIGLGVWADSVAQYYALERVIDNQDVVIDAFAGRRLLVFVEPTANVLWGQYTTADSAWWDGDDLRLSSGELIRQGVTYDIEGERVVTERPLQVFTRWYGFALTFPHTEIYDAPNND